MEIQVHVGGCTAHADALSLCVHGAANTASNIGGGNQLLIRPEALHLLTCAFTNILSSCSHLANYNQLPIEIHGRLQLVLNPHSERSLGMTFLSRDDLAAANFLTRYRTEA
jgi:hypothetical protein